MIFKTCNKEFDISQTELNNKHYIGEGEESFVYKFGDKTFKMYKSKCKKNRLDEKTIRELLKIKTKRVLLPTDIIIDDNEKCIGHVMEYIRESSKENIKKMNMKDFISELRLLKDDLMTIKDNNIIIDDINDNNYIYNEGFYFIDPGSYKKSNSNPSRYIEIINRELMHEFILKNIIFKSTKLTSKQKEKIHNHLPIDEYMCDVLDYDIDEKENITQYVKRIVK